MRTAVGAFLGVVCVALAAAQTRPPTKEDAASMRIKMDQIHANAEAGKSPVRTTITQPELNAFLLFDSKNIPKGVEQPSITMMGGGRLTAQATVNLDNVSAQSSGILNPMRLLTGRLPVSTTGTLRSGGGSARYELESAQVSGVTVPKSVLQQVLSFYSTNPENPDGLSLDEPFPLPARIDRVEINTGSAVVVQ